jgi:hypothetical protein
MKPQTHKHKKISSRDDLGGMFVNMGSKLDLRELIILWIAFLFLHTEMFAENFLKRISGALNEDNTMTMKGTFISSLIMMVVIMICMMVF